MQGEEENNRHEEDGEFEGVNDEENDEMKSEREENKKRKKKRKKSNKKKETSSSSLNLEMKYYIVKERDAGRCAIAKDKIPKGSCLLREQGYKMISHGNLCLNCGQRLIQNNDNIFQYCLNTDCQENFESDPKICLLKEKLPLVHEIAVLHDCSEDLLLISLFILFSHHNDLSDKALYERKDQSYVLSTSFGCQSQISHLEDQTVEWKAALRGAFQTIFFEIFASHFERERDAHVIDFTIEIAARVNSNSFGIFDDFVSHKPFLGLGVFPVAAMTFNHSCRPNLINIYVNGKMEYRTTREILKDEELCLSYINSLEGFTKRREELASTRFFACSCPRCHLHRNILTNVPHTINLPRDLLADLMLDGLYCASCGMLPLNLPFSFSSILNSSHPLGPSGVVVLSLSSPRQCVCLQCRQQVRISQESDASEVSPYGSSSQTLLQLNWHFKQLTPLGILCP
jgi:hypothetical protein